MGTKRALVTAVREVIQQAQPGTILDAFAGMCSVGEAIGESRQVWNNDVQVFASNVAKALFVSQDAPLSPLAYGDVLFPKFDAQRTRLQKHFAASLIGEAELLTASTFSAFQARRTKLDKTLALDIDRCRARSPRLFVITYAGNFFGVSQAIEVDAIVASLRHAKQSKSISVDEHRWAVIALGRALLKVSNSTGHFAQFLKPKAETYRRYIALRKRSLWSELLESTASMSPVGEAAWRKKNRAFNRDSLALLPQLAREKAELGAIYADPPYTDDQYSRFYHILETLWLYDYPKVSGEGLYRSNRFRTPFSLKSKAAEALTALIKGTARTGADLILSYPTNGLANLAGADIGDILRKNFKKVEISHSVSHQHSTFGASKGSARTQATELIYFARSG